MAAKSNMENEPVKINDSRFKGGDPSIVGDQPVQGSDLPSKEDELATIRQQNEKDLAELNKKKAETVTVNKEVLDQIVTDNQNFKKQIERLTYASDLGRLGTYDEKNKIELPKVVRLNLIDGLVILGWKTLKDSVEKVNGVWRESQLIQLTLENDTVKDVPYLQFIQEVAKVDSIIISRTKESSGEETLKVQRSDNGKEYLIDIKFIN